jgi:hypothetical protein
MTARFVVGKLARIADTARQAWGRVLLCYISTWIPVISFWVSPWQGWWALPVMLVPVRFRKETVRAK